MNHFMNTFHHSISQNCETSLHSKFLISRISSDIVFCSNLYDKAHINICYEYIIDIEIASTLAML